MGTPFAHDMGEGFLSAEAIANPPPFDRARAAVVYTGVARRMVQALKYNDRTDLAPWMARWMLRAGAELVADADVVVPVPLHWRRFLSRRFNQSAELARAVAALSGKPFEPLAIPRVKVTRQQVGLGLRDREDNVRGAFKVPPEHDIAVRGRRVLVVDDVYTTGATVSAVAQGAEEERRRRGRRAHFRARPARGLLGRTKPDYIGGRTDRRRTMADVTIYTRMMCGYCTAAKRLLDEQGRRLYRARCQLFAGAEPGNDLARQRPHTFPQIFVGDFMSAAPTTCMRWTRRAGSTGCSPAANELRNI